MPKPKPSPLAAFAVLIGAVLSCSIVSAEDAQTPKLASASPPTSTSMHTGAPIQFELWSWEDDESQRKKIRDLKDGDKVPLEALPNSVQFRFRILADHNGVFFKARSADEEHKLGWESNDLKDKTGEVPAQRLYRAQPDGYFPQASGYVLEVKGFKDAAVVGATVANIEFVKAPLKPLVRAPIYAASVGRKTPLPKSAQVGAGIQYELWQWGREAENKLLDLKDGAKIAVETLPGSIQFHFRVNADYDAITCNWHSTDSVPRSTWTEKDLPPGKSGLQTLLRANNRGFHPQIGRYALEVKAEKAGRAVAQGCINIELVSNKPIPMNTTYLAGKKDWKGNTITTSKPVNLGPLNETPVLKDNNYSFESQKALSVINWERFPPFRLNSRFPLVWASRRFSDEEKFGGPLNRGFTTLANIHKEQDNLRISERSWFHYPGQVIHMIDSLLKKDPVKYGDLKGYKDHRSAFASPENATLLGRMCYEGWGVAGWGPYDPGIYGWDEEEMYPTIATAMMKKHPEELPERLMKYRDKVQAGDVGATQALEHEYDVATAEFVGNTYKGARASAAERGRTLKIWHYGPQAPGKEYFTLLGGPQGAEINPKTGKYRYEEIDGLHSWFKKGRSLDFNATTFAREVDYFHTDFYFHINFPETASMYQKDANGYVLDDKGRRKIRKEMITENIYAQPTKIGLEDYEWGPIFLKCFIAKEENNQFWFNGGKYYKTPGTQITNKQMPPYIRPGTQETFGEIAKLGSRPVNPYLAEATTILTFMTGAEALFVWDENRPTSPVGQVKGDKVEIFGDLEFAVKGLHRVSQFNKLFDGQYSFIRPVRHYNTHDRDHPIIRGLLNGQYLVMAMLNPGLDPGERQEVEVWYDSTYAARGSGRWAGKAFIEARKTHLYQCKLPALPAGQQYDPDRLYFRYKLEDGKYTATFTVTGNYEVKYPFPN